MSLPTTFQFALGLGSGGALVDVSEYQEGGLSRLTGRESVFEQRRPGAFSFTLRNADGRFTPGSAAVYATALDQGTAVCTNVDGRLVEGVVDSIKPEFGEDGIPSWATVTVDCFDMLGVVARRRVRCLTAELAASSMTSGQYFPLNDPAGSTVATDARGGEPLLVGGNSGSVRFGRESDLVNSFDTAVELNPQNTSGSADGHLRGAFGITSAQFWFTLLRPATSRKVVFSTVLRYLSFTGTPTFIPITLFAGTGSLSDRLVYNGVNYDLTNVTSLGVQTGLPRFVSFRYDGAQLTLAIDDVLALLASPSVPSGAQIGVGGSSRIAGDGVSARFQYLSLNAPTLTSESPYSRWLRSTNSREAVIDDAFDAIGDLSPVPNDTLPTFRGHLGPLDGNGKTVFDIYDELISVEDGELYPTTTGAITSPTTVVTIRNRDNSRPATVTLTLSARDDLDGVPAFTFDNTDRVSIVDADSEIDAVTVVDTTLQARIGSVSGSIDIATSSRNQLIAAGEDRIVRGNTSGIRINTITVDVATSVNVTAADLLALELGDRIRITDLPEAQLGYDEWDGWVRGINEDHTVGASRFTLSLEPAFDISVFDTARFGDSGALSLNASINSSVTSLAVATTGPTLSTTAVPYTIQIGDEQMTVTACTGATPQVLTVTRAANGTTAAAHTALDPVTFVGAGRFAY